MSYSEGEMHEGEDLEVTRPNPRVQAERAQMTEELKEIARQTNGSQTEVVAPKKSEEQSRAERKAQREDDFFAEGGISGYWANSMWIVENAAGQYISFRSAEEAFEAQKQSADRLAKRAQEEEAPAGSAETPSTPTAEVATPTKDALVSEQPEVPPQPELNPEALQARQALEDRVFSGSQEVSRTLFGGIMVKGQGEVLSYKTREEYEQAWQGYRERKLRREIEARAAARESSQKEQSSVVIETSAQGPVERPLAVPAEAQPAQPLSAEKPTEEEMTPERTEMLRANQEAYNRYKGLDNLMAALRGITDNELRGIGYRLQDARDGTAGVIFQLHRNFTDALNRSAGSLMDAQRQTKEMVSIEGARVLTQAVQEQARAVDRAYEEMSEHLKSILNGGSLEYGTKTRADLEAYLGRTQAARQQLARLAQ